MSINMIGIDYKTADISIREKYVWTMEKQSEVLLFLKKAKGINGCVVLSTCNRTEIWVSCENSQNELYDLFYQCFFVNENTLTSLFVLRKDSDAINHLFCLACGLESKILGEDQILTQIKDAQMLARKNESIDSYLEVLFNLAIKTGKETKTQLKTPRLNNSIVNSVISLLKEHCNLQNTSCLVVGSGTIGKEVISSLINEKANVTVATRPNSNHLYISNECNRIYLDDITKSLQEFDIIISATLSSNYIINNQMMKNIKLDRKIILIDLAVPRDIEPTIADLDNVSLYNLDDFKNDNFAYSFSEYRNETETYISEGICKYTSWVSNKAMYPTIEHIIQLICEDNKEKEVNMKKNLKNSFNSELTEGVIKKTVKKLLFELSLYLKSDVYQECVSAMEKVYLLDSKKRMV